MKHSIEMLFIANLRKNTGIVTKVVLQRLDEPLFPLIAVTQNRNSFEKRSLNMGGGGGEGRDIFKLSNFVQSFPLFLVKRLFFSSAKSLFPLGKLTLAGEQNFSS